MPAIVLVGAQWGDEGKGKATDLLGAVVDYVVKYNGGNNAGHTVVDRRREVRPAPAALRHPHARRRTRSSATASSSTSSVLFERDRRPRGARRRHVAAAGQRQRAPHHAVQPHASTRSPSASSARRRIGTTGRGIGPTYADKMNRVGIRVQDLFDEKILRQKVEGALELKNQLLVKVYNRARDHGRRGRRGAAVVRRPAAADGRRHRRCCSTRRSTRGKTVLLEGGQATLLDVDHGTYPFVTSSNATAGGACTGSGIPPTRIDRVIAVVKAYTTRVGEGPFPTELLDADGERAARRRRASSARRPAARAAAAGTTRSSPATPRASTASPTSSSPSSTC